MLLVLWWHVLLRLLVIISELWCILSQSLIPSTSVLFYLFSDKFLIQLFLIYVSRYSSLEVQVNLSGAYILLSDSLLVGYSTWIMLVLFLDTTESFGMSGLGSLLYASSYLESSVNNVSLRMSYPLFQTNFSSLG